MNGSDLESQSLAGTDRVDARDSVLARPRSALRAFSMATLRHASKWHAIGRRADKGLGVAKACASREHRSDPIALSCKCLLGNRLQPCSMLARQINRAEPRYSEKDHHISKITARPRPLSVTESIALPPRLRGGQYVKYQQIQYPRVARASGIAADLFCAVGRQLDDYSLVVRFSGFLPSAQANNSFVLVQRPLPLLANEFKRTQG